ncbi:MAG: multifunctional CCA addition/repair protein [Gammaproteobacteria bacterium]|nr:multifunctional CCA addition/repair protein [Gammaproteobacteria bacterium]
MQVYLVGGAVRDKYLGIAPRDRDWVVVGSTPEEMLAQGFRQVGADFPVFLHPQTHEQYALARTERKSGPGYHGFICHAEPTVTLEADLLRRDLTINAMAEASDGTLIDPYGGLRDLQQRQLRHVCAAFAEDPLRILRVARYAARYHHLGFEVAAATQALMAAMVAAGEVDSLVAERVWQESAAALAEPAPQVYLQQLRGCGALAVIFPEIDALYGVPQPPHHHPEIDCGLHTEMVLAQAAALSDDLAVRFAALLHDLGKATTDPALLPRHIAHEERGYLLVQQLCKRLKVPRQLAELGELVARYHGLYHRAAELRPETLLKLLQQLDVLRRPQRLNQFLLACEADSRGRLGFAAGEYPQASIIRRAYDAVVAVEVEKLLAQGFSGKALGEALQQQRVRAIAAALKAT